MDRHALAPLRGVCGRLHRDVGATLHRSFGESTNSQENIGLKVQRVDVEGNVNNYTPLAGEIPNNSVQGLFETDYIQDLAIFTTLFNPALSDSFATFHVSLWEDEVGAANLTPPKPA